ncbi:hypothetical protein [Pseudoalteromonas tunicata]|jgi:aminomethyltransferase|uniref:Putative orphan protein putative enzyme n=1 Tax=Pseudoalteromonas tunicata D2 TaxID=87626 RepID=A4CCM7_9GAMM|nr:hypothetical protein [Pseudoalteromonas tunicata]ATC93821.1 hypothetical protein PTUN_a1148 [Pseudoalteromonas tunicata]AXT29639.1 hypothetical protein D1819_01590 [Pseudoalteromonas tunicata]EAR27320.1 putative orphan protein; putative enzyme [Pseudoalteromonas tunicata D2]MDP4982119.1 hypothetical protein [Pseudoalteromonas tunicata]
MAFQPKLFASHLHDSTTVLTQQNSTSYVANKWVFDIGGSAVLPFLRQILVANVAKLTTQGMGLQSKINGFSANQNMTLDVYYFSESAFRLVVNTSEPLIFANWLTQFETYFDIDVIVRDDLAVLSVQGADAFKTLVDEFALTPGLRLSDYALRFGAQSNAVFLTAVANDAGQSYELIANPTELANWQSRFIGLGFNAHAA